MTISRSLNRLVVSGRPGAKEVFWLASGYHQIVDKSGFSEVVLDFSSCEIAFERFMLPVISISQYYSHHFNIDTELLLPEIQELRSLFHNANWAHLIDPNGYESSTFEGIQHLPAHQFEDPESHHRAVDRVLDMVLASLPNLSRDSLSALKWCLDEIADNVISHAQSGTGGIIQASTFAQSGCVEFVISDSGVGIPASLGMVNHKRAIEEAIKEGVTRNRQTNMGNGLFGSFQVATISGGSFEIISGKGYLSANGPKIKFGEERPFFHGTSVAARIDCSKHDLLDRALRFGGERHDPSYDYIEQVYEKDVGDDLVFHMKDESKSFGSREAAKAVSTKISNLLKMNASSKLIVDCSDVPIVSSSFADEVFGKLFVSMGPLNFISRIEFRNVDHTMRNLIDRSITQRASF